MFTTKKKFEEVTLQNQILCEENQKLTTALEECNVLLKSQETYLQSCKEDLRIAQEEVSELKLIRDCLSKETDDLKRFNLIAEANRESTDKSCMKYLSEISELKAENEALKESLGENRRAHNFVTRNVIETTISLLNNLKGIAPNPEGEN